jgi:hypothetical protein
MNYRKPRINTLVHGLQALQWQSATKRIILGFAVLSWLWLAQAKSQQVGSTPPPLTKQDQEWVDETLKGLSLEEKVGQMLQVRCYADYASLDSADYKSLREELQKYHIGSVVLAAHINRQGLLRVSATDVARVTNQLQTDSKLPLLVAADLERGVASRLNDVPDFPWPMAFGAVGNATEVERFAAITARQVNRWQLTTELHDASSHPALMVRLKVVREKSGDRILPALYSDNYVALMPGERRTILTELAHADTRGEKPRMVIEGFNTGEVTQS